MYTHDHEIRVKYGETDQMGFVYYGVYPLYYEAGRTEAMRHLGVSYKSLEEKGILLAVYEMQSKYLKPARYDDLILVRSMVRKMPGVRLTFDYEIYTGEQLVHTAYTTLIFLDRSHQKPCQPPDYFLEKIRPYFEDQ